MNLLSWNLSDSEYCGSWVCWITGVLSQWPYCVDSTGNGAGINSWHPVRVPPLWAFLRSGAERDANLGGGQKNHQKNHPNQGRWTSSQINQLSIAVKTSALGFDTSPFFKDPWQHLDDETQSVMGQWIWNLQRLGDALPIPFPVHVNHGSWTMVDVGDEITWDHRMEVFNVVWMG